MENQYVLSGEDLKGASSYSEGYKKRAQYTKYTREEERFESDVNKVNYSKANPYPRHNSNKEVEITSIKKASGSSPDEKRTWRNNLFSIITGVENSSSFFPGTNVANQLNVDSRVYLCLEEVPPQSFKVKTENGFGSLVSTLTKGALGGNNTSTSARSVSLIDKINIGSSVVSALKGGESSAGTFNPWSLNSPTWDDSQTDTFSLKQTFHFKMGQYRLWNAKEEVVKPLLNLMAPVMNQQVGALFTKGPFPSCWDLLGKCVGENWNNLLGGDFSEYADLGTTIDTLKDTWGGDSTTVFSFFQNLLSSAEQVVDLLGGILQAIILAGYKQYLYTVKIGSFMTFNKVFYEDAEVRWSSETDQFGFPIAGSITITFRSILPPAVSTMNKNTLFATLDTTLDT